MRRQGGMYESDNSKFSAHHIFCRSAHFAATQLMLSVCLGIHYVYINISKYISLRLRPKRLAHFQIGRKRLIANI